jgi:hypothetical protein
MDGQDCCSADYSVLGLCHRLSTGVAKPFPLHVDDVRSTISVHKLCIKFAWERKHIVMTALSISYWYDEGIRANKRNTPTLSILKYHMTVMQALASLALHNTVILSLLSDERKTNEMGEYLIKKRTPLALD